MLHTSKRQLQSAIRSKSAPTVRNINSEGFSCSSNGRESRPNNKSRSKWFSVFIGLCRTVGTKRAQLSTAQWLWTWKEPSPSTESTVASAVWNRWPRSCNGCKSLRNAGFGIFAKRRSRWRTNWTSDNIRPKTGTFFLLWKPRNKPTPTFIPWLLVKRFLRWIRCRIWTKSWNSRKFQVWKWDPKKRGPWLSATKGWT